jgi:hypothetical protein
MTEFELRFQDLLRHPDWRVEPCYVWIGSSGEWASGETHQRVIHRADPALYVIPRLFRSIVSPKMRSFSSWAERRQLVKFAREVVRMGGLSAAVKARDGVADEASANRPARVDAWERLKYDVYRDGVVTRTKPAGDRPAPPKPPPSTTCRVIMPTTSNTLRITKRENFPPTPDDFIITVHDARFVISAYDLEKFRVR